MEILIFTLLAVGNGLPWQYRGWINDCMLYFEDRPHENISEIFLFCKANYC
jgi:hypothetical protein